MEKIAISCIYSLRKWAILVKRMAVKWSGQNGLIILNFKYNVIWVICMQKVATNQNWHILF